MGKNSGTGKAAYQKSAKDIAFDKERAQLRSQIRRLEELLQQKDREISLLKDKMREKDTEIAEKTDWIERLLQYTDLSEAEMRQTIEKERQSQDMISKISALNQMLTRMTGEYARI